MLKKTSLFLCLFALAFSNLTAQDPSFYKKIKYETSLAYTQYTTQNWWSKIEPFNIYLGALPLKSEKHLEKIIDLGVSHVLCMVENFEMEDGWINQPVKISDWESNGIVVRHIQAADFLPLTKDEIEEGVEFLNQQLLDGHSVYVHCKAGRGRSATIVIVYLMKYHGYTFDEAFTIVKNQRPQINLNPQQKQAIFDYFTSANSDEQVLVEPQQGVSEGIYSYFQNINEISEEKLTKLLPDLLYYVIEGGTYSAEELFPQSLSTWIPPIEIQSTLQRRNRYLKEFNGNASLATEVAIKKNHGISRRLKIMASGFIPFIGTPTSHSMSLWYQLREIALIASLHGHDINDPEVQMKMLSCLVGGNLLKIPAATVDLIVKTIVKKIASNIGIQAFSGGIPVHLIFNYFTDNSAKVSTHAIEVFGGENSIPVNADEYLTE